MADYKKDEKEKVAPWVEDINELVTRCQWKRLLTATFVLKLLSESNSYGNRLEKDIFARTHNTYKPNPNELYPVLRLLEDKGFVKANGILLINEAEESIPLQRVAGRLYPI
uniref:PadR family transcriptional regulator n=1 Tax=uncultured Allisonella sp. TaxID=339338 RepID=UPI00266ED666|nr:helix-turn-helix transcriptional regulator [uncultured Allisonella sp.]